MWAAKGVEIEVPVETAVIVAEVVAPVILMIGRNCVNLMILMQLIILLKLICQKMRPELRSNLTVSFLIDWQAQVTKWRSNWGFAIVLMVVKFNLESKNEIQSLIQLMTIWTFDKSQKNETAFFFGYQKKMTKLYWKILTTSEWLWHLDLC